MLHIILFQPEIPPNAGNVIRLAANCGFSLHLIKPLGFALEDKQLKRAGLDYHEYARLQVHESLEECLALLGHPRVYACTTKGTRYHHEVAYREGDALLFGRETAGLPPAVRDALPPEQRIKIPMRPDNRSLNLSNAVAVIAYEAWRQLGFAGAQDF
ncbi:MAG: tRNA (cytidine(34)-2'-O)-methyltransferase [Gammaproteobacteria bacterium]|nr:tRNA (cytidine(34)-2'-O)-methyltransferase [Gammaproteobacteria bacterium]